MQWGRFFAAFFLLILGDLPWLATVGNSAMRVLGEVQREQVSVRVWAAGVVYVALAYLVSSVRTLREAAFTGAAVYAVYDFTNYATLKNYKLWIAIADTVWGGVLFGGVWWVLRLLGV